MHAPASIHWEPMGIVDEYRAKVIGGWLYKIASTHSIKDPNVNTVGILYEQQYSLAFIPDPQHLWDKLAAIDYLITRGTTNG